MNVKVVKRDPLKGYIDTHLWVPRSYINVEGTKQALTFVSSDKYSGETKMLAMYKEAPYHLLVPRAFWTPGQLPFEVVDCRPLEYERVEFTTKIQLDHRLQTGTNGEAVVLPTGDDVQRKSFKAMSEAMGGVLQLACGKGKTFVALYHMVQSQAPALILLDNGQLLHQWREEIERMIHVPGGIGLIADGQKDWKKGVVLATYISVANWVETMPEEVRRWFANIYWDEGHHVGAPVFSQTAAAFYGRRYCLTATPERADGYHIIADMHVGKVLHKDLTQPLTSRFIFYWTGLELDLTDPNCDVFDKNKEVHTSKVFTYFGKWRPRLYRIIQDCYDALQTGRRILVVGNSVDEVVNLMTIWTHGVTAPLITDIPFPTPFDVGETLAPLELDDIKGKALFVTIKKKQDAVEKLKKEGASIKLSTALDQLASMELEYARYLVWKKCDSLHEKHRRKFIKELISAPSSAGFMVRGVPAGKRQEFVRERSVTFAIMKYGKEGLDAPHLDTIIVSAVFSSKGGVQQLMGRITGRPKPGKKKCIVVFYRDNIGAIHGMCEKLERHLRNWPVDEGGPYDYEHLNNPSRAKWQKTPDLKTAFGQL